MNFGDLYSYSTKNGVVIPNTANVKTLVENAFVAVFGEGFSVDPTTPQGRIIEAITLLFVDVLRICAVNANGFNPQQAVGIYLDNLGQLFGVDRLSGEADFNFRKRINDSSAGGVGYALSVRRAISQVAGVTSVCVLDNGNADTAVLPNTTNGIAVSPHSVFICVAGGDEMEIAEAIFKNLSAGCSFEKSTEYGEVVTKTITNDQTNTSKEIYFYRPEAKDISFEVVVRDDVYTGTDIEQDTKKAIADFVNEHSSNYTITKGDIASAIAAYGTGIVCTEVRMISGTTDIDALAIRPYQSISVDASSSTQILVNVI